MIDNVQIIIPEDNFEYPINITSLGRGLSSLVKGTRFRVWSRRSSGVQIPPPASKIQIAFDNILKVWP